MIVQNGVVTASVRIWLRLEGLAALALSVVFYQRSGATWWMFAALLLAPDLAMLPYLINPRVGAVSYNLVHSYLLPLTLALAAICAGWVEVLPYLLIWTAHIGMDRLFGYGLKYPTAFGHTHLGSVGTAR